jgi:anti-anti-sigma factor
LRPERGGDLSGELSDLFTIEVSQAADGLTVVGLGGEVDIAGSPELERRLRALGGTAPFHVVVDLSQLTFIDSSGIRALIVTAKTIGDRGGRVILAAPQPNVQRVFVTVHLSEVIPIEESLAGAITLARNGSGEERAAGP